MEKGLDFRATKDIDLVQWCFFLPGTENLQVFRENCTEKQPFYIILFFSGSNISKNLPTTEDLRENTADSGIIINDRDQVLFCIPAVTKNDDMIFAVKFRHNLPDHGGCQFQFGFFLVEGMKYLK